MKRVIYILLITMLFMCGCARNSIHVEKFSYSDVLATYSEEIAGVKQDGFVNTEKRNVTNAEQAIELAKKECNVNYNSISVAYDEQEKIYCVMFGTVDMLGGCQSVYLSSEGITLLKISGE